MFHLLDLTTSKCLLYIYNINIFYLIYYNVLPLLTVVEGLSLIIISFITINSMNPSLLKG